MKVVRWSMDKGESGGMEHGHEWVWWDGARI